MILHCLTQEQIDNYIQKCHFTDEEKEVFLLRTEDRTIMEIAEKLNFSRTKANSLSKRINNKLIDVGLLPKML